MIISHVEGNKKTRGREIIQVHAFANYLAWYGKCSKFASLKYLKWQKLEHYYVEIDRFYFVEITYSWAIQSQFTIL